MAYIIKTGVFGGDGESPLYDPEPFWREFSINDIFRGGPGKGKIIPKIGDHVRDPDIYATYRVVDVDQITFVPRLERIYPDGTSFELNPIDILFGVGFGTAGDTYRLHVNNNVYPYVACPDSSLKVSGNLCKYARIFRVLEDGTLEVISKVYDSSGRFISDMVNLEKVQIHQVENYSTKVVPPFKLTTRLNNNDHVVVYCYSDDNNIVSKRELLVEESAFVRSIDESLKYVTHISLKTPYLSNTDSSVINMPLNLTVSSLSIKGLVHYSNGDVKEFPIDGGQFALEGLEQLLSSIEGQERSLIAFYTLAANEVSFSSAGLDGRRVAAPYKMVVSNDNVSYSVKLFPAPIWRGDIYGYAIKWFLINMDRNKIFDVTDKIEFMEETGAFNPFGFGYIQRKQVSLNLQRVSPTFSNMNHTQVVDITLYGKPSVVATTPWIVRTESDTGVPEYGQGVFGKLVNLTSIDISVGETVLDTWLDRVYYAMAPLVDPRVEVIAPRPTHFVLTYNDTSTEYSINEWNSRLSVTGPVTDNTNVIIKFIRKSTSGDMNLTVCSMAIKA